MRSVNVVCQFVSPRELDQWNVVDIVYYTFSRNMHCKGITRCINFYTHLSDYLNVV